MCSTNFYVKKNRIKKLRYYFSLKQKDVMDRINISKDKYRKIENNEIIIEPIIERRFAKLFDISVSQLYEEN